MLQAFRNLTISNPVDIVYYLVHIKQNSEIKIQAKIFQEFVSLMENALPLTVYKENEPVEIFSLADPDLNIFTGRSVYSAAVKNNKAPNETIETYIGSKTLKNHGPCFIGKLLKVTNKATGECLLNKVKNYSFVEIELEGVTDGTEVEVVHLRIPSHYEINSMVYLQRIRRNIVDRVYVRKNGVPRPIGMEKVLAA
jgi:hypothetical protein